MGCADCCAGTVFTFLTLTTIGIATLGTISLFTVIEVKKLYQVSEGFHIGVIIALVVVCLIFLFAIYASCCGGKAARGILGTLFLIIAVPFVVFAAFLAKDHDKIPDDLKFLWEPYKAKYDDARAAMEKAFHCHGFSVSTDRTKPPCREKIGEFIDDAWEAVVAVAIVMAVLLLFGTIVACCYACRSEPAEGITYRSYGYV
jgi:hypothetical protein